MEKPGKFKWKSPI